MQKGGVPIGLCIGLLLSNLHVANCGAYVKQHLETANEIIAFRYVADFLAFHNKTEERGDRNVVSKIMEMSCLAFKDSAFNV